jgi:DNA-binding transcriptional LysR family regulator
MATPLVSRLNIPCALRAFNSENPALLIDKSDQSMQPEQIETFLDLCETRSFHRSAERLGVTQSTVSARLKALEDALGVKLFLRSRAGTDLTTEGLRFAPHARSLRAEWAAAMRAATGSGARAMAVRLGIQADLGGARLADWLGAFRAAFPETAFHVELDYSNQMCADLIAGTLDFAVMFTPRAHPDLHVTPLGDLRYRMISTHATTLRQVDPDRYVHGIYAPAFETAHRTQLPDLSQSPISVGRSDAATELILGLGATGYVFEDTARDLVQDGRALAVVDAPALSQPVHAATRLRQRSTRLQIRLAQITRQQFRLWYGG